MMQINVRVDIESAMRSLQALRTEIVDQAAAAALNKTADKARTAMTREIVGEFNIERTAVRNALEVSRASKKIGKLTATLRAFGSRRRAGRSLNLIHFLERSVSLAEARRRQRAGNLRELGVKIKRRGPAQRIGGAFIGSKGRTVFRRVGQARLPIQALATVDVPQMFNTRRINDRVIELVRRESPVEFERAARYFTDRFNARR